MKLPIYQVDAFSDQQFGGNPAAVVVLDSWPDDGILQFIAAENNLSETAFICSSGPGKYALRWFTPAVEIDLCGHATLAAAHVHYNELNGDDCPLAFDTQSGRLTVCRSEDKLTLDFPARPPRESNPEPGLLAALGLGTPVYSGKSRDWLIVLECEAAVRSVAPDFAALKRVCSGAVIVSAAGDDCDFVSRFFCPGYGIDEDPVTGSAHCTLAPYWSDVLKKQVLSARQLSKRGGELECRIDAERVFITGQCVSYLRGEIEIGGSFQ